MPRRIKKIRTTPCSGDEIALINASLGGDDRAFEGLMKLYQSRLQSFIVRQIGDQERAEELVQEVFIRVWRHLPNFQQSKKFSTWIYTIASNLAKNELRRRSRNVLVLFQEVVWNWEGGGAEPQFEDAKYCPDEMFHHRQRRELVDKAIAALPPAHRQVFKLREREGKSYDEIAKIAKCNPGTVKSRLNRARAAFAKIIEPQLI